MPEARSSRVGVPHSFLRVGQRSAIPIISGAGAVVDFGRGGLVGITVLLP